MNETKIISIIKKLIFVVFLLMVFEAPLRKWIFPSYSRYLFFVRDPFILLIYILSLRTNIYKHFSPVIFAGIAFSFIGGILIMFQIEESRLPFLIYAYGWRNYFFAIPLAGIIQIVFEQDDFIKLARLVFYLSIPSFFLAYFQSISPSNHWLNAGFTNYFVSMGVTGHFIRPTGFFSSSFGQGLFLSLLFSILISIFMDNSLKEFRISESKYLLLFSFATFSLAICGQRASFVAIALLFFSTFFTSIFISRQYLVRTSKLLITLLFFATFSYLVFPAHLNALWKRVLGASKTASQHQDIIGYDLVERVFGAALHYREQIKLTPQIGFGIGFGGNAASKIAPIERYFKIHLAIEDEWSRHIIEFGPLLGICFIAFRIFIFTYIGLKTFYTAISNKTIMPFLLFASYAPLLFYGQLTGNGLGSGWVWFFIGITLSLCKINTEKKESSHNEIL